MNQFYSVSQLTQYSASMGDYVNQQEKISIGKKCYFWAKNGQFQDKKHTTTNNFLPKDAILWPLSIQKGFFLGLLCRLRSIFCRKKFKFHTFMYIGMIKCEKNDIFKIGDFVHESFTLTDT